MTSTEPADLSAIAAELQASLPQTPEAYASDMAGWLAQRVVGVAALLDERAAGATAPLNTIPPDLPAGFAALGPAWSAPARQWETLATQLDASADADVRAAATQLRAYAATQPTATATR